MSGMVPSTAVGAGAVPAGRMVGVPAKPMLGRLKPESKRMSFSRPGAM
jgi:hypothetical protein